HDVKIMTTLHGTDITVLGMDKTFKPMIKYAIEKSDKVTAVSNDLANQTKAVLDVDRKNDDIYNCVNEADYFKKKREYLKEEYGISKDGQYLNHVPSFCIVTQIE